MLVAQVLPLHRVPPIGSATSAKEGVLHKSRPPLHCHELALGVLRLWSLGTSMRRDRPVASQYWKG